MKNLLLILLLPICLFGQIKITEYQVYPFTHANNCMEEICDGNINTAAFGGYGNYPRTVIINLAAIHTLSKVMVKNNYGNSITITGRKSLKEGDPEQPIFNGSISGGSGWQTITTTIDAKWIYITQNQNASTMPEEFQFYGIALGPLETFTPYKVTGYTINASQFGINAYSWNPDSVLAGLIPRFYCYNTWTGDIQNAPNFKGTWYDDQYINKLGAKGWPCCQSVPNFIHNASATSTDDDLPPCSYGANRADPMSYAVISQYANQMAAQFNGKTNQIEFFNEYDKGWAGVPKRMNPFESAALGSAIYDGNEGKIPNGGIKNASPSMKLIMPGLTFNQWWYVALQIYWFKDNRADGKYVFDVVNFHQYSTSKTKTNEGGGKGISPEAFDFADTCKQFTEHVKTFLPNIEVKLTEYGWDCNNSIDGPLDYPDSLKATVQASWNIRAAISLGKAGLNDWYWYQINDNLGVTTASTGLYTMSGTRGPNDNGNKPKPASRAIDQLIKLMGTSTWKVTENLPKNAYMLTCGKDTIDVTWITKNQRISINKRAVTVPPVVAPPVVVPPIVIPPVTPLSGWNGEYYPNNTLSGTQTLTRTDSLINFNWGAGSPSSLIPIDFFSARWSKTLTINADNNYTFIVNSDNGSRLKIDGMVVLDNWIAGSATESKYTASFKAGESHSIILEYFEKAGGASCKLEWSYPLTTIIRKPLK